MKQPLGASKPFIGFCLIAAAAKYEDHSKDDDPGAVIVKKMA